ncbi:MAG: ABC transporter ATP-binding protein, partial [Gemmobacter sp.]
MTVAVEARDLWKTYPGGIHAVKGINFRIEPGELMVLVGASGCGKTTTLRMVAGLERVSDGQILVGDRVVNDVHPARRGVALMFQNFALYPHKTTFRNIAFPLESAGVPRDEIRRRVIEVAEMLELSDHLHKTPDGLSGGQQQRVSLGRAIVR